MFGLYPGASSRLPVPIYINSVVYAKLGIWSIGTCEAEGSCEPPATKPQAMGALMSFLVDATSQAL